MSSFLLQAETRKILEELEAISGFPVAVIDDPDLDLVATLDTASATKPMHLLRFRPKAQGLDYRIALEAGQALRLFRLPPQARSEMDMDPAARAQLASDLAELQPKLHPRSALELATQLHTAILNQVRSCPIRILVDIWIHARYPGLRTVQASILEIETRLYASSLENRFDKVYPPIIVRARRLMNAAHALFVADLLNMPQIAAPYRAAGLELGAAQLLDALTHMPAEDIVDRDLIMAWARMLELDQWIRWRP